MFLVFGVFSGRTQRRRKRTTNLACDALVLYSFMFIFLLRFSSLSFFNVYQLRFSRSFRSALAIRDDGAFCSRNAVFLCLFVCLRSYLV